MKEITLSTGVIVRVQSVPPLAVTEVVAGRPDLGDPPLPLEDVKGIAGVQTLPARAGTTVYEEWFQEKELRAFKRAQVQDDFTWDYGIVGWKHPGEEDFTSDPPKAWKFPQKLKDYGKAPREGKLGKRVDYIKYALFVTPDDVEAAQIIMYAISPITKEEIDAAASMFPGDEVQEAASS